MTGAPISLGQQQVATVLAAGLADPAGIIAVTGEPGLGKTVTVANAIRERGLTAWFVLPVLDDLSANLALLHKSKLLANFVLVIEDAHALSVTSLKGLFAVLEHDRTAFPRVVFVARPTFWQLFDDPALARARDRIRTVAVLFPMNPAESERFLRHRLGANTLRPWARTLLQNSRGNPRLLCQTVAHHSPAPGRQSQPRRRRLSARTLSGPLALLVLILAMMALALSMTDGPAPSRSVPEPTAPQGAAS